LHSDTTNLKAFLWGREGEYLVLVSQIDQEVHCFNCCFIVKSSGREIVIVDLAACLPEEGDEGIDRTYIGSGGEVDTPLIGSSVTIYVPGELQTVFD